MLPPLPRPLKWRARPPPTAITATPPPRRRRVLLLLPEEGGGGPPATEVWELVPDTELQALVLVVVDDTAPVWEGQQEVVVTVVVLVLDVEEADEVQLVVAPEPPTTPPGIMT